MYCNNIQSMSHPSWELPSRNNKQRTSLSSATRLANSLRKINLFARSLPSGLLLPCVVWADAGTAPGLMIQAQRGIPYNPQYTNDRFDKICKQGDDLLENIRTTTTLVCAILLKCMSWSIMANPADIASTTLNQYWFNVGQVCVSGCNATAASLKTKGK